METYELTQKLLEAKKKKGKSFSDLGKLINRDEVWVASFFYRQASASEEESAKLGSELDNDISDKLTECPTKGLGTLVPTDFLIYRFYEIMQVYGMPVRAVIHEKFGDGIMSAIDFTVKVDKAHDIKGDRVKITMDGKILPYKKW